MSNVKNNFRLSKSQIDIDRMESNLKNNFQSSKKQTEIDRTWWKNFLTRLLSFLSFILLLIFIFGMIEYASPFEANSKTQNKYIILLPVTVFSCTITLTGIEIFNMFLEMQFGYSLEFYVDYLFNISNCVLGSYISIFLTWHYFDSYPPFIFPIFYFGGFIFQFLMLPCWFLITNLMQKIENTAEFLNFVLKFCYLMISMMFVPIIYIIYGTVYRYMKKHLDHIFIILVFTLVWPLLQLSLLRVSAFFWNKISKLGHPIGTAWIILCQSGYSNILQSTAFEDDLFIFFLLMLMDIIGILRKIIILYLGENPLLWIHNFKNKDFLNQIFEPSNQHRTINQIYEITLTLFLEFFVTSTYGICIFFIFYSPNFELVLGVGSKEFGYYKINDLYLLLLFWISKALFEFILCIVSAMFIYNYSTINIFYTFISLSQTYGNVIFMQFILCFMLFFMVQFLSFTVDISFYFEWT